MPSLAQHESCGSEPLYVLNFFGEPQSSVQSTLQPCSLVASCIRKELKLKLKPNNRVR